MIAAGNHVGAEGAASLSEAMKYCSELRQLDVSGTLLVAYSMSVSGGAWLTHMGDSVAVWYDTDNMMMCGSEWHWRCGSSQFE